MSVSNPDQRILFDKSQIGKQPRRKANVPQLIFEYQNQFGYEIFIETGTYRGETTKAVAGKFKTVHTIELSKNLASTAEKSFKKTHPHVVVHQGASEDKLQNILAKIDKPAIFWLDAHYSAGNTARGKVDTPIMQEIQIIFDHKIKNHVVLIDDMRYCRKPDDGLGGPVKPSLAYPSIHRLAEAFLAFNPLYDLTIKNDIFIATPPKGGSNHGIAN